MLDKCLQYYGLYSHISIARTLRLLAERAQHSYPNGYQSSEKVSISYTHKECAEEFGIKYCSYSHHDINEIFRYAALFGLIVDLSVYPDHLEFSYNPFHRRDIFFAELTINNRLSKTFIA
ncbi:MAG: hypothetical protein ACRCS8_04835 [Brevinema sp.]